MSVVVWAFVLEAVESRRMTEKRKMSCDDGSSVCLLASSIEDRAKMYLRRSLRRCCVGGLVGVCKEK